MSRGIGQDTSGDTCPQLTTGDMCPLRSMPADEEDAAVMTPKLAASPNTDPQPLELTEELARGTTRQLARNLESVALLIQCLLIVNTALADRLRPGAETVLFMFAGLHLALALASYRKGGLFSLGGPWVAIYVAGILLTPLIMASLLLPGQYGSSPACVQLCGYPVPPVALLSFYPWISVDRDYLRPAFHLIILFIIIIEPLLVIRWLHGYVSDVHYRSVGISASLTVTSYLFGKVVGAMCRSSARRQLDALDQEYRRLFEHLHTHVEGALAAIQRQLQQIGIEEMPESFRQLSDLVNVERVKLLLANPDVDVPKLLNLHAHRVQGAITVVLPRVGGLTITRSVAPLLDLALGALLKNAVVHRANMVRIGLSISSGQLNLTVTDDGPGFDAAVFDDPANNLHTLRNLIREKRGDLLLIPGETGATLRLSLPLD